MLCLEHYSALAICLFECNYLKLKINKYHLLIYCNQKEHILATVGNEKMWESKSVQLLGITIDKKLKFNEHVK